MIRNRKDIRGYKRRRRRLPARPYRKAKQQVGMRAMRPITRRRMTQTALHQQEYNFKLDLPDWSEFYSAVVGQKNLNQTFTLNTPQLFSNGGSIGSATGNEDTQYLNYSGTLPPSDVYDANGTATMANGFIEEEPKLADRYFHYQVLGAEVSINIRAVHARSTVDGTSRTIPMKVHIIKHSSTTMVDSSLTTEELEAKPYVQTRIINGLEGTSNKTARFHFKHSIRKFNGLPKGQFVGDSRYLGIATSNQIGEFNNVPQEVDFFSIVFTPLSSQFANTLPATLKPPVLYVSMKMKKLIKYTDPNSENIMAASTIPIDL